MTRLRRGTGALLVEITVPLALLVAWWLVTSNSVSPYWPPLRDILETFRERWLFELVPEHLVPSVLRLVAGFMSAVVIGVAAGIALGLSARARDAFTPMLDFVRAIPMAALIPPAVLLIGTGQSTMVVLIAFAGVWPILLNTVDGIRGVDPELRDMARVYQLSRRDRLLRIDVPAASPQIFAGFRVALSLAVLMMVLVEVFLSADGVGYVISTAQTRFQVEEMWAALFVIMILAYAVNLAFARLEAKVLRWHRESKGAASTTSSDRKGGDAG